MYIYIHIYILHIYIYIYIYIYISSYYQSVNGLMVTHALGHMNMYIKIP